MLVTELRKEALSEDLKTLDNTLLPFTCYIRYLVQFQENARIQVLINSGGEINIMTPTFIVRLHLSIQNTNVGVQKLNRLTIVTYMILGMPLFSLHNVNIRFTKISHLTLKSYIATEALSTTKRVELINNKEFAETALDNNAKIFVIYITILLVFSIYPS